MKKIIKLTERDLTRIVKRVLREQEIGDVESTTDDVDVSGAPDCIELMTRIGDEDEEMIIGSSPFEDLVIDGDVQITYNATVSPNYRSVTIVKNGKPFCKIPVKGSIGDCGDEMEVTSDAPGSPLSAELNGPVTINITGSVAPKYQGTIIKDANGYFCKVPSSINESRIRRRY